MRVQAKGERTIYIDVERDLTAAIEDAFSSKRLRRQPAHEVH